MSCLTLPGRWTRVGNDSEKRGIKRKILKDRRDHSVPFGNDISFSVHEAFFFSRDIMQLSEGSGAD